MKLLLTICLFLVFVSARLSGQTVPLDSLPSWQSNSLESAAGLAWGDVDGDGDLDLACAKSSYNGLYGVPNEVYLNINGVLETTPSWRSTESDVTWSVAWGDVDGDGDLDLACGNFNPMNETTKGCPNRVYLNVDGMLERTASWSSVEWDPTWSVTWGDVDNDGDLDLACGNNNTIFNLSRPLPDRIYYNIGGRLDSVAGWTSQDSAATTGLAWADVDGDGFLDLAAGSQTQGGGRPEDVVYHNIGGTLELSPSWRSRERQMTWSVAWGDADNDGDLDLACGSRYWPPDGYQTPLRIYINRDGILEDSASWLSSESFMVTSLSWGDVDGDGDQDLAVTSQQGYGDPEGIALRIFLQHDGILDTVAAFSSRVQDDDYYGYVCYSSAWGDIDNDGDLDLAMGAIADPIVVLINHSSPVNVSPGWTDQYQLYTRSLDLGDIDNDGDLDLVCGNWGTRVTAHFNTDGMLESSFGWNSQDADRMNSVDLGDMNGDGYLDLVRSGGDYEYHSPSRSALYINLSGTFETSPSWTTSEAEEYTVVKWGDVDGDGDLDLACGTGSNSPNKLYLNNGLYGGLDSVASWTNLDYTQVTTAGMAWGDVDNDGDLDLACANGDTIPYYNGYNLVYYNHNGILEDSASWVSDDADVTNSVAWGDVDGDGDLDLACGNSIGPNRVYLNYNGRLEKSASWTSEAGDYTTNVAWVDIDLDGDLDLATSNGQVMESPNRIYINHNGVLETKASWESPPTNTWGMAIGDIDGDGDPDLVYGNRFNNTAHMSRAVTPRTNTTLPNTPPRLNLPHLVDTDTTLNRLTIGFDIVDYQSDLCDLVAVDYSTLGGGNWRPATVIGNTSRLSSSPTGEYHEFIWDAEADRADGYDVKLRIKVASNPDRLGLIQWPALTSIVDIGRVDSRPRIALLYPKQSTSVIDSMPILAQIWDATNFSDCSIMVSPAADTSIWQEVFTSQQPKPYPSYVTTVDLTKKPPGEYIIRVIASDRSDRHSTVDKHIDLKEKKAGAPAVIHAFPGNDAIDIPCNAPVVIQFDRDISQPKIDNETFNLFSVLGESYTDATYDYSSRTLTLKPPGAYAEGLFHYAIAGGHIASRQAVTMGGEFVFGFNTSSSSPTTDIDSLSPFSGQIQTPVDLETVTVHFHRTSPYRYITIFSLAGDTILTDVMPYGSLQASVPIIGLLPKTYYIVRISDSPEFDGSADYMSYFITEDTEMPLVVDISPRDEAWLVRVDEEPVVRFNKQINTFTIDESSCYLTGAEGILSCVYEFSGDSATTLTLSPDRPLTANSYFTVTLTPNIEDNIGNHVSGLSWSFTTGAFDTVGYDGGVMKSEIVELKFQAGSMAGDQEIGIGIIPDGQLIVDPSYDYTGLAVDIEPPMSLGREAVLSLQVPVGLLSVYGDDPDLKFYHQSTITDEWEFVGGSLEGDRLSTTIDKLGRFAVFASSAENLEGETLSNLTLSPRVVRPQSGEIDNELVVSYELTRSTSVEVRIYNTAGRLMALVPCPGDPGTNLIRWDGRDSGGDFVTDGLYVLLLTAGDKKAEKTFVVMKR